MKEVLAIFSTTYETLRAEDYFRAEGIKFRPVLKPRKIGSACRMALKFGIDDVPAAKKAVKSGSLDLLGYYVKEGEDWMKLPV